MKPPVGPGPIRWMRQNLFSSWFNTLLTLASVVIIYFSVTALIRWIFLLADWTPILNFPTLYLIGQYPRDQLWRIGISLWLVAFMFGVSWGFWGDLLRTFAIPLAIILGLVAFFPTSSETFTMEIRIAFLVNPFLILIGYWLGRRSIFRSWMILAAWFAASIFIPVILRGFDGNENIPVVETTLWGGLLITLLLAVGGITLSFPIGVALALGRQSTLPVVKFFSTMFIETIGVPLVSILFMFSIILALFLPPESRLDRLIRALLAMTFFSAAYTAENVRGGLQAVGPGQTEAAKALGLNNLQVMAFIVLPQALRAVIPAIVGQFISLFKDTTLAIIVGISEILFIGKSILNSDPAFVGSQAEVYIFIAAIFWIFSYIMSAASRQLESALGVGKR